MSLAVRDRRPEQMDAPDLPADVYAAVLTDLAKVNRLTLSARPTLAFLKRALAGRATARILDVGFGDGDMLRTIARWGRSRGLALELVGIDLNPGSAAVAAAATPPDLAIDWRTGDCAALAGEGWDVVLSSFVAHHMSDAELNAFLRFMENESAIGWLVNDLHRHWFAHAGYPLLARLMRWHRIVREDGTLSIARSFRREDWVAILARAGITQARIVRRFPFRLCVERLR
ncbi:methyltransferase domain-containing protein [Sphingomonas sp. 1P06PA]|uniref:methyltransferase domain-containing protein n=1 Tax=Sphingomonas sp. 1P06PA TaxID=554121 RepID=UPI0039A5127D